DEFITMAMVEKLEINKSRQWPEPKDGEPRLHIKEQPAPVVPVGLRMALSNAGIAAPESDEMLAATHEKYIQALVTWVKDRKPFQPAPVVPEECPEEIRDLMASHSDALFNDDDVQEIWNACRAAMLNGDSK
ncbi:dATP/dGTP pyrophosphohydrolase domain-containing protein, partial [Salmonella enterica]